MKKTIIALMALAGVAMADSIVLDDASWVTDGKATVADGTISTGYTNWQVDTASYTLGKTLSYTQKDTLTFSFSATSNGTGNSMLTLALIGTTKAIVVGHGTYDKPADELQAAVTDNLTANGYGFASTNPGDDIQLTPGATLSGGMPAGGATTTISGSIAWDGNSYSLTLSSSAVENVMSYDLGITTLDLSKIMVTLEGGNGADTEGGWAMASMSNLSISAPAAPAAPEPTTATLSLLALAGLAARRRRK